MTTPSERLQALIDADRADLHPTPQATADTWSRIAQSVHAGAPALFDLPPSDAGASAGAPPAAATIGAGTGGGTSLGKLLVVGSLFIGGGAAIVAASVTGDEPSTPSASASAASTSAIEPNEPAPVDPAAERGPEPSPSDALVPDLDDRGARKRRRSSRSRQRHAPAAPSSERLSEALETIAEAQRALSSGTPQRTLSLLRQRSACPEPLAEDCRALRALASCALGQPRAIERGAKFLRRYPHSIYAERVEDSCRDE